ncbi:MAG TPA: hypothetical protein VKQ36_01830 [Ktedonobacterales bacterium]|nr:hypothetical protein [Ktedonobacterales bacterium]
MLGVGLATLALLSGCGSGGTAGATQTKTPTPEANSATATPHTVDGVQYMTYTDPTYGFQIDLPAYLDQVIQPNIGSGGSVTTMWSNVFATQDEVVGVDITTKLVATKTITCQTGRPITVGPGLPGCEIDTYLQPTPPPIQNSGTPGTNSVSAEFIANGVEIGIMLGGDPPVATFLQRYGAIWQHMLASFKPGPPVTPTPISQG